MLYVFYSLLLHLWIILYYTQVDKSETAFEVSIVAEILRSLISVDFANLIVDFLVADCAPDIFQGDPR